MKLLVAIDFSKTYDSLISYIGKLGNRLDAGIWLLHVANPHPELAGREAASQDVRDTEAEKFHQEHRKLQEASRKLREAGLDCTALLVQGVTSDTILEEAGKLDIDMIVLGTYGKGPLKKMLIGSTNEDVIRESTIPVLVVPPHALGKEH